MLRVENLSASYSTIRGDVDVLKNVSFVINDDEIFGIAGESGCGKTTLLKTLYDIIEFPLIIKSGRVVLVGKKGKRGAGFGEDHEYVTGEIRQTWWSDISYVPQAAQSVLNPITRLKSQFLDSVPKHVRQASGDEQLMTLIKNYLTELNLSTELLNAFPFQLSGGMRQRIIVALATFMAPSVALADEPTTALDVVVQRDILMLLVRLQRKFKNSLVLVSHDMGVHYQMTKRMGVMYSGSLIEIGATDDIFNRPKHPYTRMLVEALPRVGDDKPREGIPGRPPNLASPPPGCRFAPRCPHANDNCRKNVPNLIEVGEADSGHMAACFFEGF